MAIVELCKCIYKHVNAIYVYVTVPVATKTTFDIRHFAWLISTAVDLFHVHVHGTYGLRQL